MRVTSIAQFRIEPGTYLEWPVALGEGEESAIPPSFNQTFHLSPALGAGPPSPTVWIAAAFEVPGRLDVDAATWAISQFIERHAALRTTFTASTSHGDGPGIGRRVHNAADVRVGHPTEREFDDGDGLASHLRARLDAACHPSRHPSYCFAAVDRCESSTIVCGFDHAHVDAVSITVAVEELSALYQAYSSGGTAELDPAGSFVEYCALEADTPAVPLSDRRIAAWSRFVSDCGGGAPSFPFDLGVAPGEKAPQETTVHALASAVATQSFEQHCRTLGAGMFAAVAAAMAQACVKIGGPRRLPLLFPLHTRHEKRFAHAVGWFTTNAPMTVTVGNSFADTLESARSEFRAALPLATVPISRILGALGDEFVRTREDVFMISYVDYRSLPGAGASARRAHHISNVTTADDAQFWISRTDEGLSLRARFPDTPRAHRVVQQFATALTEAIRAVAVESEQSRELSLAATTA
ncbi:hypothetical protein C5142_06845 [Rhodococcus sp. BGS-1C]|uniref:condensation domain-containing protein n=1 Tax=unclassified Rhodococcus (in: high G+C Gram-positive bacteria) TaxID=192944 RepID=UPI003D160F56